MVLVNRDKMVSVDGENGANGWKWCQSIEMVSVNKDSMVPVTRDRVGWCQSING